MLASFAWAAACLVATVSTACALQSDVTTASPLPADIVWRKIGGFCGIADWHPIIAKCDLSDGGKQRALTAKNGVTATERVEAWDDAARSYTYTIVGGTLPVANYRSTISVVADGKGSKIRWVGSYDAKGAPDAEVKKLIDTIYKAGEASLAAP